MMPARDPHAQDRARYAHAIGSETTSVHPAAIQTRDGRYVAAGLLELHARDNGWTATLGRLDRPAAVASMYFTERVRDVILRLEDGRTARARITGTTFIAAAERVCHLRGLEPLAQTAHADVPPTS